MSRRRQRDAAVATAAVLALLLAACNTPPKQTGPPSSSAAVTTPTISSGQPADAGDKTIPSPSAVGDTHPIQPPGDTAATPAAGAIARSSVNNADPNSVAIAVVTTLNRQDTTGDASPLDAVRRAAPWLTSTLLADSLNVPQRGDTRWSALAAHRGYTAVDRVLLANEIGQPPNTATTAYVQVSYQTQKFGRDGWQGSPTGRQLSRLRLTRTAAGAWQVTAFLGDE